jgi:hypothetical protein
MAYIDRIWIHDPREKCPALVVYIKLKPSGQATIKVELPEPFSAALLDIAQSAADLHEARMRAEILGDNAKKPGAV